MLNPNSNTTNSDSSGMTPQLDRVSELANIGAGHAATALSQLVGREYWMTPPRALPSGAPLVGPCDEREGGWCSAIFFELEGELGGLVAVIVPRDGRDALVHRLLGEEASNLEDWCVESALMEVGNILVSHVATAIADTLGGRVLPGLPQLTLEDAGPAFEALVREHERSGDLRIESELRDRDGGLGGMVVLVPDRTQPES